MRTTIREREELREERPWMIYVMDVEPDGSPVYGIIYRGAAMVYTNGSLDCEHRAQIRQVLRDAADDPGQVIGISDGDAGAEYRALLEKATHGGSIQ